MIGINIQGLRTVVYPILLAMPSLLSKIHFLIDKQLNDATCKKKKKYTL